MSLSNNVTIAAFIASISLGACVMDEDAVELGSHAQKATTNNGMPYNGMPYNGMPYNGMPYNGMPYNGLPSSDLTNNGLLDAATNLQWSAWLNDPIRGSLNNNLMTYLVKCALDKGDSASFQDILAAPGDDPYEWEGELGLAPGWATSGLTEAEQRWVTACVISLVNEYSLNVQISQRGPLASLFNVKVPEVNNWTVMEAAFFGNMFAATPTYYSCISSSSYAVNPNGRNCGLTDENDNNRCGQIEVLGLCEDICDVETLTIANKPYVVYKNCTDPNDVTYENEVITTALQE